MHFCAGGHGAGSKPRQSAAHLFCAAPSQPSTSPGVHTQAAVVPVLVSPIVPLLLTLTAPVLLPLLLLLTSPLLLPPLLPPLLLPLTLSPLTPVVTPLPLPLLPPVVGTVSPPLEDEAEPRVVGATLVAVSRPPPSSPQPASPTNTGTKIRG